MPDHCTGSRIDNILIDIAIAEENTQLRIFISDNKLTVLHLIVDNHDYGCFWYTLQLIEIKNTF